MPLSAMSWAVFVRMEIDIVILSRNVRVNFHSVRSCLSLSLSAFTIYTYRICVLFRYKMRYMSHAVRKNRWYWRNSLAHVLSLLFWSCCSRAVQFNTKKHYPLSMTSRICLHHRWISKKCFFQLFLLELLS